MASAPIAGVQLHGGDGRAGKGCALATEVRQDVFAKAVGLFQVRVAGQEEQVDANAVVLPDACHHIAVAAHQRAAGWDADVAESGPDVGVDEKSSYACWSSFSL